MCDGNLYALRQHEKQQADADAKEEFASELTDDIESACIDAIHGALGSQLDAVTTGDIAELIEGDEFFSILAEKLIEIQIGKVS